MSMEMRTISTEIGIRLIVTVGHSLSQVNFTGRNSYSVEIEFGGVGDLQSDIEIENYLVNRSISNEYRDAGRSGVATISKMARRLI